MKSSCFLGLEAIYQLTKYADQMLRVDMIENGTGAYYYAEYRWERNQFDEVDRLVLPGPFPCSEVFDVVILTVQCSRCSVGQSLMLMSTRSSRVSANSSTSIRTSRISEP